MVGFDVIADLLSATRRRLSVLHAACGASEATALAGATLLLAALLTSVAPPGVLRALALGLGLAGVGWAAWRYGWQARRVLGGEDGLARLVERRSGVVGVLTAVQLRRDLGQQDRARAMSEALARAAIDRTASDVADVAPDDVVPAAPFKPRLLALLTVALAWTLSFAVAPDALRVGLAQLAAAGGAGLIGDGLAEQVDEALAGDMTLIYRFPEYTGLPDRTVEGAWGEIQAIPGTRVALTARAFEPVEAGSILFTPDEASVDSDDPASGGPGQPELAETPLAVEGGRAVSGQITVTNPGSWRFSFVRPGGRRAAEEGGRRIEVLEDARPRVELVAPAEDGEVEASAELQISWRARDDYGITGHHLALHLGEVAGAAQQVPLEDLGGEGGREAFGQHQLQLKSLDIQPGDVLRIYVEATDNNTVDGPRAGRSDVRTLRIRSPLDRHNELMSQLRAFWDKLLLHLADRLEAEPPVRDAKDWPAIRKNVDSLNNGLGLLAAEAGELLAALQADEMSRTDLLDGLKAIRDALERDMREEDGAMERAFLASERGRLTAGVLGALWRAGEQAIVSVEKAVLRLDELFGDQSMQDIEELTRQLVRSQERLRSHLEQYKAAPDAQTKQRIQREINRLRTRIADLMRRLSELMKQMPMEHLNRGALEKGAEFKAMDLANRLQAMQEALDRGDVDEAMRLLEQMENDMQELMTQLQADRQERDKEQDMLREELAAIRESLEQVRKEQDAVTQETAAVDQAARDRRKELMEERLQEFLEKELAKVERLDKALQSMPPEVLNHATKERHDRMRRHAERLRETLQRHDLDMAHEIASEAHSLSQELQRDVGWRLPGALSPFMGGGGGDEGRQARRSVDDSEALSKEIKNDLEALMPGGSGGKGYDEAERGSMERLAGRQSSLERQSKQLQERMESLEQQLPMEAGEMAQGFERAAGHMDGAGKDLRRRAPRPAGRAQGEAMAELDGLDQRLERMMKPGDQGQQGQGRQGPGEREGNGRRNSRQKVDIEADKTNPEAFRRGILEAMKRQGPGAYEEQLRQYYRELVK